MPPKDPLSSYSFCLEIQGLTEATFREGAGFDSETEVIESREVGKGGVTFIKKLPGALKWSNITLRRGVTDSLDLWKWRKKVADGDIEGARMDGSVVVYNPKLQEVARYNFRRGWPNKWKGPDMNATANEVAVEEIEIAHEGLERVK
jgi:phage tail-like protein